MPDAAKIIKDWCASCGMPEPSDGECHALAVAISAAAPVVLPEPDDSEFEQQLPIQPIGVMGGGEARKVLWNCTFMPEAGTSFYTEQQVRALLATGGQAQADMPDSFREWFAQNYPADTIIVDPDWHAKSIFRMAQAHARLAAPQAQADARDAERLRRFALAGASDEPSSTSFCEAMDEFREIEDGEDPIEYTRQVIDAGIAAQDAAIAAAKGE